ncbi:MAG: NUDIX hydrolase [bacterium]|nr:NUDIX hydrolase [bacterium]
MEAIVLEKPILAVDVVIFTVKDASVNVLLQKRKEGPFQGAPALPGVAVRVDETLENAAKRAITEKLCWPQEGENRIYLEQLATFDALYRDPRGRTVSVTYMGLTRQQPEKLRDTLWGDTASIITDTLPFDHTQIIASALLRLRGKLRYSNIAKEFLPEQFRIEKLQEVYEAILDQPLNRTNFRMKLLKIHLIERVSILNDAVGKQGGRPPHLYRFSNQKLETVDRDFL